MDEDIITEDFDFSLKLRKTKREILFLRDALAWTNVTIRLRLDQKESVDLEGQIQTLRKHKDLLFSLRYGSKVWVSILDMVFMDVLLLF